MMAQRYVARTVIVQAVHLMPEYAHQIVGWLYDNGHDAYSDIHGVTIGQHHAPWGHYLVWRPDGQINTLSHTEFVDRYVEA